MLQALLTGDFSGIADRVSPVTLELLQITSAIGHGLLDYLTEELTLEEASVLLGRLYGAVLFEVAVSAATAGAANALKGAEGAALTARILKQLESVPGLAKGKLGRISELMTDVVQELQRGLKSSTAGSLNPFGDAFSDGSWRKKRGVTKTLEQHHSDPIFMAGDPNQPTVGMPRDLHRGAGDSLHHDLNEFLRGKTDAAGNHMRPQRGNPGIRIRDNFTREELLEAMAEFYKRFQDKYPDSARAFFNLHPHLR